MSTSTSLLNSALSMGSTSLFNVRFRSLVKAFEGIPGPTPQFPLGTLGELRGKTPPWELFANYAHEYGPMTLVWFFGQPRLIINDPNLIREVLVEKRDDYYKDEPIQALYPVMRHCLFNLNSPEWDQLRKPGSHPILMNGFREWLPRQFAVIKQVTERRVESMLASNTELNMTVAMTRTMFDIMNRLLCGPDFEDGGFENFYENSHMATRRLKMLQQFLTPPVDPRFHKASYLHSAAYRKALEKEKVHPNPEADHLLALFLRQGTDVSDQQIIDFVEEFHSGGNISSAAVIVNVFHQLNEHPEIAQRLYSDLAEITPEFDLAALEKCELLDHVLRESMRLEPPVPMFPRNVRKDRSTMLGGRELPPNTVVVILPKSVQRSPDRWEDPNTFYPDRWANGGVKANPIGSDYYFPFGRGPRMCLGAHLGMFCMKIVIATVLSKAAVNTSGSSRDVFRCAVLEKSRLKTRLTPHTS